MIAAHEQCEGESRTGFRIGFGQSNCPSRQFLGRALRIDQIAALKSRRRVQLSPGEPPIASSKVRVELDAPLKELLCFGIFVRAETLHVPQPVLKGSPSIETARRFAHRTPELGTGY